MLWIQIILPISIALVGIALLYFNSGNREFYFQDTAITQVRNVTQSHIEDRYVAFRSAVITKVQDAEDKSEIKQRLEEIGKTGQEAYGSFRYHQLVAASMAGTFPFIALFIIQINIFSAVLFSLVLSIAAYFAYDRYLDSQVKSHRFQIEAEFPAVIEMLTLAIAAGEPPLSAFARISERSNSKLANEFTNVVQEVKQGVPFHEALDRMGRELQSNSIRRFIDALVMAMVRGAPIVDVLYRHVAEARINQRNLVMDKAGKAETTMMIPIVFLILPISVLFALWPSINQLSFFAG